MMENTIGQNDKLSGHFRLSEMTYSRIAVEHALDNTPPLVAIEALRNLVIHLLEPLRLLYGKPIAILSGYRSEEVNRLAGGVANSQHRKGEAADCYTPDAGGLLRVLQQSGLVFDQAIWYRKRNFLHLSLKVVGRNRMQVLLFFLCLIFMLPGCGRFRQAQKQEIQSYSDTTSIMALQKVRQNRSFRLVDTATWHIRQVVYSPPDSQGQLYPHSVTSLQLDYHRLLSDSSQVVGDAAHYSASRRTEISQASISSASYSFKPRLFIFAGIILVVGFACFYYSKP